MLLAPGSARAQRKTVAVLEFEGAPRLRAAVAEELSKRYEVVPLSKWQAAAQELNAPGRAADEIAIVAQTLKVDAVVTALVRKDPTGQWMVNVTPRHGPSGKIVDRLSYPLKSPYTTKQLLGEIGLSVEHALKGLPEIPDQDTSTAPVPSRPAAPLTGPTAASPRPAAAPPRVAVSVRPAPAAPRFVAPQVSALPEIADDGGVASSPARASPAAAPPARSSPPVSPPARPSPPVPPPARSLPPPVQVTPSPVQVMPPPVRVTPPPAQVTPPPPPATPAVVPSNSSVAPVPLSPEVPVLIEPPVVKTGRPIFYPYIDAGVGLVFGGRRLSFDEEDGKSPVHCYDFQGPAADPGASGASARTGRLLGAAGPRNAASPVFYHYASQFSRCPGFVANFAPGLRLDGTVYPLAGQRLSVFRGLGLGATLDLMFWPMSTACDKFESGTCQMTGVSLATGELRAELGLRWVWNLVNKRSRPSLLVSAQYGLHQFALEKTPKTYEYPDPVNSAPRKAEGKDDHGLPDIRYQYIDFGLGLRMPYYGNSRFYLGMLFDFHFHVMLGYGEIETTFADSKSYDTLYQGGGYGPVSSGYGLRIGLTPIELVPLKGLTLRLQGYYERFAMRFALGENSSNWPPDVISPDQSARHLSRGATDEYFGGLLQLGYQY